MARLAKNIAPAENGGTAKEDVLWSRLKVAVLAKAAHCNGLDDGRNVGKLKELTAKVVTTVGHFLFWPFGPVGDLAREVMGHYSPLNWTQYAPMTSSEICGGEGFEGPRTDGGRGATSRRSRRPVPAPVNDVRQPLQLKEHEEEVLNKAVEETARGRATAFRVDDICRIEGLFVSVVGNG